MSRLMRQDGLQGCTCAGEGSRPPAATRASPPPPSISWIARFLAAAPEHLWLADITYLPTREGFLYLSFILDACTRRRVVGWMVDGCSSQGGTGLGGPRDGSVEERIALGSVIHHSEHRGSQYTALSFGQRLEEAGMFPSMGKVGSALDNAMAESFVSTLKAEMGVSVFATRESARISVFDYIEGFYNPRRRHSSIGYMSPADYEQAMMEEEEEVA